MRPAGRRREGPPRRELRRDKPRAQRLTAPGGSAHVRHQRQSPDQALRPGPRGGRSVFRRPPGHGHRLPRPERGREDHHPADPARPGRPDGRVGHDRRGRIPQAARPDAPGRRRAGQQHLPPRPQRHPAPEGHRHGGRHPAPPGRRGAGPGRAVQRRGPPGRRLLAGHAPAAQPGRRPARRSRRAHPGRATERARPGGDPLDARPAAVARRRRQDRAGLQPPADRGGPDRGRGRRPRQGPPHRRDHAGRPDRAQLGDPGPHYRRDQACRRAAGRRNPGPRGGRRHRGGPRRRWRHDRPGRRRRGPAHPRAVPARRGPRDPVLRSGQRQAGGGGMSTAALIRSRQHKTGGHSMNATLRLARAEFRKLFTTLAVPVAAAIATVLSVGSVLINAAVAGHPGQYALGSAAETYKMLKFGPVIIVAMLILGILVAGGEFRHRTIVPALLATPQRARVFAVKVAVIALFGAVFSAVVFGLGLGTVTGVLAAHGFHTLPAAVGRMYLGTVIASACFGMIGVAIGALTRNTVVAIVAAVGWALFVEVITLGTVAPTLAKWLPVGASIGLTNPPQAGVLAPAAAGAVLAGYAVAMLVVASRTTIRRDIG